MAAAYQLIPAPLIGPALVFRVADGAFIPAAPGNQDFAAYQAWLAAGNTPDPLPAPLDPDDATFAADPWQTLS